MDLESIRKVRAIRRCDIWNTNPFDVLTQTIQRPWINACLCLYFMLQQNISKHKYQNRDAFLSDVSLIHTNSIKYNGKGVDMRVFSTITISLKLCGSLRALSFRIMLFKALFLFCLCLSKAQTVLTPRQHWILLTCASRPWQRFVETWQGKGHEYLCSKLNWAVLNHNIRTAAMPGLLKWFKWDI